MAYDKEEGGTIVFSESDTPIQDPEETVKQMVKRLRERYPNLYENFIEPKRELLKGEPLEEFINASTYPKIMTQMLQKLSSWTQIPDPERVVSCTRSPPSAVSRKVAGGC